jgi:hypothetical protein
VSVLLKVTLEVTWSNSLISNILFLLCRFFLVHYLFKKKYKVVVIIYIVVGDVKTDTAVWSHFVHLVLIYQSKFISLYKKVRFRSSRKLSRLLPVGMVGAATTAVSMGFIFSQQK